MRQGRCSAWSLRVAAAQSGSVPLCHWLTLLEYTTRTHTQAWLCINRGEHKSRRDCPVDCSRSRVCWLAVVAGGVARLVQEKPGIVTLSNLFSPSQVVHEIRNYPYPQLHFLALQGLNPSRHTSAVRESYEVCCPEGHRLGDSYHSFTTLSDKSPCWGSAQASCAKVPACPSCVFICVCTH